MSAKIYNLKILKRNIEDSPKNVTRFLVFSKVFGRVSMKKKVNEFPQMIFVTSDGGKLLKALGFTKNIKSENSEKYISIYSCVKHDEKV